MESTKYIDRTKYIGMDVSEEFELIVMPRRMS